MQRIETGLIVSDLKNQPRKHAPLNLGSDLRLRVSRNPRLGTISLCAFSSGKDDRRINEQTNKQKNALAC